MADSTFADLVMQVLRDRLRVRVDIDTRRFCEPGDRQCKVELLLLPEASDVEDEDHNAKVIAESTTYFHIPA